MPAPTAEEIEHALRKKGFRMMGAPDPCPSCGRQSFSAWAIGGLSGGRQVFWCPTCNHAESFRLDPHGKRVADPAFALASFLGLG